MAYSLLVFDIDIEVTDKHHGAIGSNALLPTTELAGLHVALHDVDTFLGIEGDPADLVKTYHVVLTDQPTLAASIVHKHFGDSGLAAGNQMGVRRNLLKKVTLTRASRPKLNHVVVALNERNHPE
ncbi:hypothetical protein D3C76_1409600 [compost metagenome]